MSLVRAVLRGAFGGSRAPEARGGAGTVEWPWPPPEDWIRGGGGMVGVETAIGLPAFLSVIRLLARAAGMAPLIVYRGDRDARERATDTWQWELLHKTPGEGLTPATLVADTVASLAAAGNAYWWKIKARGRVRELVVLDPRWCKPRRQGGRIVFDATLPDGGSRVLTAREILHIRDVIVTGHGERLEGTAPITGLRLALRNGLRRQEWEAAYLDNDARPGIALRFPQGLSPAQAQAFLDMWNEGHRGPRNAGQASALGGGADLTTIPPISFQDAQFVESQRLTLEQIAGLYHVPPSLAGHAAAQAGTPEQESTRLVRFGLGPYFCQIEQAITADPDLCPPGSGLFVEHLADALLRPDTKTRYDAYRLARQGGWMSANEIRARENLPPVAGGDEVQATPVGGAPNTEPAPEEDASA